MLKTILISILAAILVVAIGFSAYNGISSAQQQTVQQQAHTAQSAGYEAGQGTGMQVEMAAQAIAPTHAAPTTNTANSSSPAAIQSAGGQGAGGQGGGYRRGQSGSQGGKGASQAQNSTAELVTYTGVVSAYAAPGFTLLTTDGQSIRVQLGNQSYVESLGLVLHDGDEVTVTGFIDSSGTLAVAGITVHSTGLTYTLRDTASSRPSWAGGGNQ